MKKVLLMLLCILAGAQTMKAQQAYAVYTDNNTTLTFYYDTQRSSRTGTTYDLNVGINPPKWTQDGTNAKVTRVVFDSSFKNARPGSTCDWFSNMSNLTSIIGMKEYLNTSETIWLSHMFAGCKSLTSIDLSQFNTSKAKYMVSMFSNCSAITSLDLSHFDTSNALNMFGMLANCKALTNVDVSNFDTSNVTDMEMMFGGSYNLTSLNLCSFNTAKVTNMKHMFYNCQGLTTIYVGNAWTTAAVTSSEEMFLLCRELVGGSGTTYTTSHVDKAYAHIDGGTANPGYLTDVISSYANYNNGTLTFYYDSQRSTRAGKTYSLNSGTTNPGWFTEGISASITKVVFDASFANARPTSTYYWFNSCANLTSITGWENLNTSEVTNMREMFSDCRKITNLNLNKFNTSKVTNMSGMFQSCIALNKISLPYTFYTSNVVDMSYMFYDCTSLSSFNFLTYFNTSKVTDMRYMFYECDAVTTLDLSTFDTGNVTNMVSMFGDCENLTTIYIGSGWSTDNLTGTNSSYAMFANTKQIRGMQGTTYNASYVDKTYARLDEGTSKPGYLSTITYNLKIGGVEVTDMNKDNIPIESGTAKFNGSVLFLTDATIAGNASWGSIHCTRNNLTIAVNGSCTLNGTVNFRGSSYIYFTDNDDDDELTVNGMFNFKGSLQFYNRKTVIKTSSASYMFAGDGTTSKLEFGKNATVLGIMDGGAQIAYNITGLTFKSPTSFTFGSLGADDSQVSFSTTQKTILMDGQPLKGILAVGQYYPLWFGDLQMSSTIPLYIKSVLSQDAFSISEADDGTLVMKTYP
ncbi:MAG: BspA family leucine-rich repeat surface protein, partial [Prevotella sp.]|nr:BspA family leucine-rich repeat surface protein [Prevotella sp.]